MKKNIIFFVMGFALAIGISTYALSINARDTAYDNTNSGSSATNMQDAIDDLYSKSNKGTIIECGTYTNGATSSRTVNISSYYDKFADLTKDNIYVIPLSMVGSVGNASSNQSKSTSITPTYTYDATTGNVNISGLYSTTGGAASITSCYVKSFKVIIVV